MYMNNRVVEPVFGSEKQQGVAQSYKCSDDAYMSVCLSLSVCVYVYMHVCVFMYICMYVCLYVCMCHNVYVCVSGVGRCQKVCMWKCVCGWVGWGAGGGGGAHRHVIYVPSVKNQYKRVVFGYMVI